MKRFQRLLVVVQPEFEAPIACWVRQIMRSADSRELCLLHLVEKPSPLLTKALGEPHRTGADATNRKFLDAMDGPADMNVTSVEIDSFDQRKLLAELERGGYDLMIVPTGTPGTRARATFLCRKAPCPVLLVPANASTELRRILVAVDFTEFSHDAIEVASTLARACDLEELDLIHSWHQPEGYGWRIEEQMLADQVTETAEEQIREMVDKHGLQSLPLRIHIKESPLPWIAITEAAKDLGADLTVICNRGKNALSEAVLGSDATEVVTHIDSACLVVKRKGAGTGLLRELLGLARVGEPV